MCLLTESRASQGRRSPVSGTLHVHWRLTVTNKMAQSQLPLYYKNSKAVGPGVPKKRWKEYYLLVVLLFGFVMLYAGVWYVPSVNEGETILRREGQYRLPEESTDTLSEPLIPPAVNASQFSPSVERLTKSREEKISEDVKTLKEVVNEDFSTKKDTARSASNPVLPVDRNPSDSIDDIASKRKKVEEVSKISSKFVNL